MPAPFTTAALNKALDTYYAALATYQTQGVTHEQATRLAFSTLLDTLARPVGWTLVLEQTLSNRKRPDGTLCDSFKIPRGYWEAKDTHDDLDAEIKAKIARKYPLTNIIFEDTQRAVLYQNGRPLLDLDITQRANLTLVLQQFFAYTGAQIKEFNAAVQEFQARIPELARGLIERIAQERAGNKRFITAFEQFQNLCQSALNPNISVAAIEEMLVQHLLTERLFRTVFANPDFTRRNVIALEIEKVVDALTSRAFNRTAFLKSLDYFYLAIEAAAETIDDFAQKQTFLNTVYERFFQGFSQKQADTHGVVYTPQPIVDWMCASVDAVLQQEFGLSLSAPGVQILDPATGTGNFVVNLLRRMNRRDLKRKYTEDVFANEVMLLPYYIASLNIEHAYYELTGEYLPFEGICFTDTLDLAEDRQLNMFSEENTERVERQRKAAITVVIGNPPYNVGQLNENDNNKNRAYPVIDKRIRETYAKDSRATNKNALSDVYVKFFRWAVDRLQGRDGIICYVSNNSFVDQIAFDGMRKQLAQDFTTIYHLDLHGNVRQNPKLSGTTHNVFGIQVGVGITIAVRNNARRGNNDASTSPQDSENHRSRGEAFAEPTAESTVGENGKCFAPTSTTHPTHPTHPTNATSATSTTNAMQRNGATIYYHRVPEMWRKTEKLFFIAEATSLNGIAWQTLQPDAKHNWITEGMQADFAAFLPIGSKEAKAEQALVVQAIFKTYSRGVATSRDDWVYSFNRSQLVEQIKRFIEAYNSEVDRWQRRTDLNHSVDDFVVYSDQRIKWSRDLKLDLQRGRHAVYHESKVRNALYRPFCKQYIFFDRVLNEEVYAVPGFFPTTASHKENSVIIVSDIGHREAFSVLLTDSIPDLHSIASKDAFQCFPFYVYDEDGGNRRENITDWALAQFQTAYGGGDRRQVTGNREQGAPLSSDDARALTKRDIFNYVYAVLHHPHYRARYAENLKRELPRIPLLGVSGSSEQSAPAQTADPFWTLADIGARLAELHLRYEQAAEYPLRAIENKDLPWTWRVTKMRLTKDRDALVVNEALTLSGIPSAAFSYRLGNRAALEWVIDQYQVTTDKRSGLTSDPNRADDEEYIVRLIGQVVTVSVETVKLVAQIAALPLSLEQ